MINVGIRQNFSTLGDRNFEDAGTVQYNARRDGLDFLGTKYNTGDALPFDVNNTSYSAAALQVLQLFWNQGWLTPAS